MTNSVKKVEGMKRDDQDKAFPKRTMNSGNFQGSYSRGSGQPTLAAKPIQSTMHASTSNYSGTHSNNFLLIRVLDMWQAADHLEVVLALVVGNLDT